jgi:hypothetical protein
MMVEDVVKALIGYGVPGIATLGLLAVIGYLLREKDKLEKKNEEAQARYVALQEERRKDASAFAERLIKDNNDWRELKDLLEEGSKKK